MATHETPQVNSQPTGRARSTYDRLGSSGTAPGAPPRRRLCCACDLRPAEPGSGAAPNPWVWA